LRHGVIPDFLSSGYVRLLLNSSNSPFASLYDDGTEAVGFLLNIEKTKSDKWRTSGAYTQAALSLLLLLLVVVVVVCVCVCVWVLR